MPPSPRPRPAALAITALMVIAVSVCGTNPVTAQSLPSKSDTEPAGGRPKSTQIDMFAVMESAGDVLLQWFGKDQKETSIDQPQFNGLGSPRETVMTFIEAMNHVDQGRTEVWQRALQTFGDHSLQDPKAVAFDLLYVFDRLPKLSPSTLLGPEEVDQLDIRRYELFPRGIDRRWAYAALSDPPDGRIVLIRQGGSWVFDDSTLQGADRLLDSMKAVPPRARIQQRGQLFVNVMEPTFTETEPTDWLFGLAAIAIGIAVAWAIQRASRLFAEKHRGDGFLSPLINGLVVASMIISVTLGIAIGTARLNFHPALSSLRWSIVEIAFVIAGVWLLVSFIEMACLGVRRSLFSNDDPYAKMTSLFIRRSVRVFSGVVLLLFVFQNVFQWNVTAMIGGFGIIALALSLAAQDAVKNLFGAVTIFANRPFLQNDWVRFDGELGEVQDVSLQVTTIRLLNGDIMCVPNMRFIDSTVENLSKRRYIRRTLDVAITYDTPAEKLDRAMEILHEILTSEDVVSDDRCNLQTHPPRVWFESLAADNLHLRADYWYFMSESGDDYQRDTDRSFISYLDHTTIVNRKLLARFNEEKIEFAFPTQTIKLEPEGKLEMAGA